MRRGLVGMAMAVLVAGGGGPRAGMAEASPPDSVSFARDWPEQTVPYYRIVVGADGTGTETTEKSERATEVPLRISAATRAKLFAAGAAVTAHRCESSNKHTARTGEKTMVLTTNGQVQQCTFNYTEDKRLQEAVTAFAAIEVTVEEGPRLEKLLRFDRLGLDAEIGGFLQQAKEGRAIELENLRPVLEKLANNAEVMERVRSRATELLSMADAGK